MINDDQFEDVSKVRKAICWKYFLLDKTNDKAKCKVKISEGEYCDRVFCTQRARGSTSSITNHLRKQHGIENLKFEFEHSSWNT